jgi:Polysaccharide lyase
LDLKEKTTMKYIFMLSACFFLFSENRFREKQPPLLLSSTQKPGSNQILAETFEGPVPFSTAHSTDFATPYSFRVVGNPVFKGTKSARFELRDTDPMVNNGTRAEVTVVKDLVVKEMWYSFAVYFPSNEFAPDSKTEIISQWWQAGDKHLGEKNASPTTALRIQQDRFVFDAGYNDALVSTGVIPESRRKIDLGPVSKDTWHEFVFHFIHSYQPDGLVEIWHNGTKLLTHQGGNMYNNVALPKWKLGIYKWKWNGEGTTDTRKRVLYFDNIRVGKEKLTFAEMAPASLR